MIIQFLFTVSIGMHTLFNKAFTESMASWWPEVSAPVLTYLLHRAASAAHYYLCEWKLVVRTLLWISCFIHCLCFQSDLILLMHVDHICANVFRLVLHGWLGFFYVTKACQAWVFVWPVKALTQVTTESSSHRAWQTRALLPHGFVCFSLRANLATRHSCACACCTGRDRKTKQNTQRSYNIYLHWGWQGEWDRAWWRRVRQEEWWPVAQWLILPTDASIRAAQAHPNPRLPPLHLHLPLFLLLL